MKRIKKSRGFALGAIALSGALVGILGGQGYSAYFTSSGINRSQIETGTLNVGNFDATNPNPNYKVTVNPLWPGDTAYRFFNVQNTGTLSVGQLILKQVIDGQLANLNAPTETYPNQLPNQSTITAKTGTTPVRLSLSGCSVAWSFDGINAPTCPGLSVNYYSSVNANTKNNSNTVLYSVVNASGTTATPVTSGPSYIQPFGSTFNTGMQPNANFYFMVKAEMPLNSTNEYQRKTMRITYSVDAKQNATQP